MTATVTTPQLPGVIVVPSRDASRDLYLRDYALQLPGAPASAIAKGTQAWVDASTHADTATPMYAIAIQTGQRVSLDNISGTALQDEAERQGQQRQLPGSGASGFGIAQASFAGGVIFVGDVCTDQSGNTRYQCTATKKYGNGENVPLAAIDIGPQTNQLAGATLSWQNQRPGIGKQITVFQNSDGSGLTGGRLVESDPEIRARIRAVRANPPASGNDAEVQSLIMSTPGVAVEQAFTYPCSGGAGSFAYVLTVRPSGPGKSRLPSATQTALTLANLSSLPADYFIYACILIPVFLDVALQVTWSDSAVGWADASPWPLASLTPVAVTNTVTPTSTVFSIDIAGTPLVGGTQQPPVAGNVIAFNNFQNFTPLLAPVFSRKTVKTVVFNGGTSYTITCDTTNNQTDVNYIPSVGQPCCPWSDSLDLLIPPFFDHFGQLGPGEQKASTLFYDDGLRERRSPRNPATWPCDLTHRVLTEFFALPALTDVSVILPTLPYACPTGSQNVYSNMLQLRYITAFAR